MGNNDYQSWFTKHDGKTIDGIACSVETPSWSDGKVYYTLRKPGHTYTFALDYTSAISADGARALPSYGSEEEVNADFNQWFDHVKNLFNSR